MSVLFKFALGHQTMEKRERKDMLPNAPNLANLSGLAIY